VAYTGDRVMSTVLSLSLSLSVFEYFAQWNHGFEFIATKSQM